MNNSSDRLPKVSIVQTAGKAKTKLTSPKPKETSKAVKLLAPACEKTEEE